MSSGTKWRCTVCTYENWPAAIKCTLCRSARTASRIEEEMHRLQVSTRDGDDLTPGHACVSAENDQKLIKCASCTYLNKPKSFKCEQCFHVLCDPPDFQCAAVRPQVPSASVPTTTTSTIASPSPPPPQQQQQQPSTIVDEDKWSCPQCTYENWPKSKHCVMCYGQPPPPPPPQPTPSPVAPRPPTSTANHTSSISADALDDECGARDFNNVSTEFPGPRRTKAVATLSVYPNSTGVHTPTFFRDKLWLAACRAVIDGEVTPIERYILTGGRMERKLTKQECRYLDNVGLSTSSGETSLCTVVDNPSRSVGSAVNCLVQDETPSLTPTGACASDSPAISEEVTGSRFRAGLTLVDLAIRCGRTDLINLFIALSGLQATSAAVSLTTTSPLLKGQPRGSLGLSTPPPSQDSKPGAMSRRLSTAHPIHPSLQQIITRAPSLLNKHGVTRSKWMPCQASPNVARELRAALAASIKHYRGSSGGGGDFPCAFINEWSTFALPHAVGKLPAPVKYLLLSELCDTQAQSELEEDAKAINWWFIPGQKQASRLFALWNRTAGDCLLDSVLQACWGIFDQENCLRRTLAETLRTCEASFYSRWRDYEALQAACHYILDESQCRRDWDNVLAAADQPGGALEQIHIFALSHILRRPIIVYGVKYIKNYRDEPIGIANFQGIYIPLLWDRSFCSRNPIVLGYTRGHFTALVPMEPQPTGSGLEPQLSPSTYSSTPSTSPRTGTLSAPSSCSSSSSSNTTTAPSSRKHSPSPPVDSNSDAHMLTVAAAAESLLSSAGGGFGSGGTTGGAAAQNAFIYLPLVDRQGGLLPVHFTTEKEANLSQILLRDWLDVVSTRRGLPLARLRLQSRHALVDRMTDDWLESYRSLAKLSASANSPCPSSSSSSGTINALQFNRDSATAHSSTTDLCDLLDPSDNRGEPLP